MSVFSKIQKRLFSIDRITIAAAGALFALMAGNAAAQTTDSLMLAHPEYTASGYLPYQEPDNSVKYTKAPAGYKPFYISHYGRHGSRYHYSADDYKMIYETLAKADTAKALSMTGKYVMIAAKALADKAAPRAGDLTQAGVKQHEGIATRMAKNFKDVFKARTVKVTETNAKGKQVTKSVKLPPHVDAYASTSGRCILSMSAFLGELRAQKPKVEIHQETGKSLMAFINTFDFGMTKNYAETAEYKAESDKLWQNISTANFVQTLFTDTAYVQKNINVSDLYNKMFEISGSILGMEEDNNLIIFDRLFSKQEKLNRWKAQNAWWYSVLGTCPLTGNDGVNTAKPVLEHILNEAEKAVTDATSGNAQGNTVATLRFGHDTAILPLAGLMQLSIANAQVKDLSKLHEQWTDFKIIPMAANLQMIFYSKKNSDVLVKFLYNEREVTAPIPCGGVQAEAAQVKPGMALAPQAPAMPGVMLPAKKVKCPAAPYYRWDDVKDFYKGI